MANHTKLRHLLGGIALLAALMALAVPALASVREKSANGPSHASDIQFYVPTPNHDAVEQIADLRSQGRTAEASQIQTIISTPTAVWVESGSPKKAEQQVRQVTHQAAGEGTIPIFVIYNIPFRDCAQYSAGGATSVEQYKAWIDGVARGIGERRAILAVEPDGLGIIPWYTSINGQLEWCQPADASPASAAADRFAMLN